MLIEIRSQKFRTGVVTFHSGLNVILGDANATNSIGKSTMLMVVDFAFGGKDLLEHNDDVVKELGHHEYFFTFQFDDEVYRFCRDTSQPDTVYPCGANFELGTSDDARGIYRVFAASLRSRTAGLELPNVGRPLYAGVGQGEPRSLQAAPYRSEQERRRMR